MCQWYPPGPVVPLRLNGTHLFQWDPRVSVVPVDLHGGHAVGAGVVRAHAVVEVAERHVLRHVGGGALVVVRGVCVRRVGRGRLRGAFLEALLVTRLHELYNTLRGFYVCHDRSFSLKRGVNTVS